MKTDDVKELTNTLSLYIQARTVLLALSLKSNESYKKFNIILKEEVISSAENEAREIIELCESVESLFTQNNDNPIEYMFKNTTKLSEIISDAFISTLQLKAGQLQRAVPSIIEYSSIVFLNKLYRHKYSLDEISQKGEKAAELCKRKAIENCSSGVIPFLNTIEVKAYEFIKDFPKDISEYSAYAKYAEFISNVFNSALYFLYLNIIYGSINSN